MIDGRNKEQTFWNHSFFSLFAPRRRNSSELTSVVLVVGGFLWGRGRGDLQTPSEGWPWTGHQRQLTWWSCADSRPPEAAVSFLPPDHFQHLQLVENGLGCSWLTSCVTRPGASDQVTEGWVVLGVFLQQPLKCLGWSIRTQKLAAEMIVDGVRNLADCSDTSGFSLLEL